MKKKTSRRAFAAAAAAVIAAVTLLSLFLSVMFYSFHLTSSMISLQKLRLLPFEEKVSYSLNFGKSLEKYYGMEESLRELADEFEEITNIYIVREGEILYSAREAYSSGIQTPEENEYTEENGIIRFSTDFEQGTRIVVEFDGMGIDVKVREYALSKLVIAAAGLSLSLLIVIIIGCTTLFAQSYKRIIAVVMVVWQLLFGAAACVDFLMHYYENLGAVLDGIAFSEENSINSLLSAGISYDELVGIEESLEESCGKIPEFEVIIISDSEFSDRKIICSSLSVGGEQKYLLGRLSPKMVRRVVLQYFLENVMLIVISLLIITEFQILLAQKEKADSHPEEVRSSPYMRTFVFIVFAALYMGMSFNSVTARAFADAISPASAFLTGIPATAETAAGFAAVLLCAGLLRRLGMKRMLNITVLVSAAGLILSGLAENLAVFAFGRLAVGAGCGLVTITGRTFALSQRTAEGRTSAMASLSAGSIAGLCFGTIFGGLLNDRIPSRSVYVVSAVLILTSLLILGKIELPVASETGGGTQKQGLAAVLKNAPAAKYLLLVVMPVYACSMFISYSLALICSEMGMSTLQVSALILMNSLISGYMSPLLSRLCMKYLGSKRGVALYAVSAAGAIALMSLAESVPILIAGVIILGAAESYGIVVMTERLAEISSSGGSAANMVMFTLAGKLGQAAAPTVISLFGGSNIGLSAFVVAGGAAYFLLSRKKRTDVGTTS